MRAKTLSLRNFITSAILLTGLGTALIGVNLSQELRQKAAENEIFAPSLPAQSLGSGSPLKIHQTYVLGVADSVAHISWQTSVPAAANLEYGLTAESLAQSVSLSTPTTNHEFSLTNLKPQARYYFRLTFTDTKGRQITSPLHHFYTK